MERLMERICCSAAKQLETVLATYDLIEISESMYANAEVTYGADTPGLW